MRVVLDRDDPAWLVYPNTGAGFGPAEEWTVPKLAGESWYIEAFRAENPFEYDGLTRPPHWELADLDADGAPEWVQTTELQVMRDPAGRVIEMSTGPLRLEDARPVWNVHAGVAVGFSRRPEPWILPEELPGLIVDPSQPGPAWRIADMTGDRLLDLVVPVMDYDGERLLGSTPRWRVYPYVP